ncbi:MAG: S41 family peptidase [Pyrinomonadaceae bacterium]
MNRFFLVFALILLATGAVLGGLFGRVPKASNSKNKAVTAESITADYDEAVEVIDKNYGGKVDHEAVLDSSVQRMLWTLDPHSSFFTQAELTKLFEEQQSEFAGIGVSILQHRDGVYVQSVVPGTPADKGGLHYGDKFIEVDGKSAESWTSSEVSKNVRGKLGSPVNVKVERAGSKKPLDFTIVRGGVPLPSIRNYFMLNKETGYVGLSGGFQETTAQELDQAIANLQKAGMKNLLLDLRGNRGGLLPQAIEVTSRFIPRGQTVVSVRGRSKYMDSRDLRAVGGTVHQFPLVLLIDGGSASASEIVAGAIQDYARGLIVGTESFGKGLVQKIFQLPYGTGLTLTTARYYTPFGRSLQRDYSNGSIYEYYTHQSALEAATGEKKDPKDAETPLPNAKPKGKPIKTAGGREYYGGEGIDPDLNVPPLAFNDLRFRISEDAFFFTRELAAGNVAGFEDYKTEKQTFQTYLEPNEAVITSALFNAFLAFVDKDLNDGLTSANVRSQNDYAKMRLREQIATAKYSSEAGYQVLLEGDPQVLSGVQAIPQSAKLMQTMFDKPA